MTDQARYDLPSNLNELPNDQIIAICKLIEAGPRLVKHLSKDGSIIDIQAGDQIFKAPEFIKAIQLMYQHMFIVVSEPQPVPSQPMQAVIYAITNKGQDFLARHRQT